MKLRLDRPLVCFDLESTGLDTQSARIVEIGLVRLLPDGGRESLQRRVDPGIDIPEAATRVHGIRNDDVRGLFGEPPLSKVGPELLEFMADADLAGFNCLAYDLPLWAAEVERHGLEFSLDGRRVLDAKLVFDGKERSWDRFLQGPRNLNNAVLHYCGRDQAADFSKRDSGDPDDLAVDVDAQARHSAVKDAEATLDVLIAQLERYPDLPCDIATLHDWCARVLEERRVAG